jgi:hypothetical protein
MNRLKGYSSEEHRDACNEVYLPGILGQEDHCTGDRLCFYF